MNICIPNSGQQIVTSRVGTTLLAPVAGLFDATGPSAADFAGAGRGFVAVDAAVTDATSQTHKYMNRPGSPPRGTTR